MEDLIDRDLEKKQCKLAILVYLVNVNEYMMTIVTDSLSERIKKKAKLNSASLLDHEKGDLGLMLTSPMSLNTEFCYGYPLGKLVKSKRTFYLRPNGAEEDPDFHQFQKLIARKFKENELPFYITVT